MLYIQSTNFIYICFYNMKNPPYRHKEGKNNHPNLTAKQCFVHGFYRKFKHFKAHIS